jgi:quercetin dioxygenase-like cupin family protein
MSATNPFASPPGEGPAFENPAGGVLTFKAQSGQTGGAFTALDTTAAPADGPPLHTHEEDELIQFLEGHFRVKLGDELVDAPAGTFVFIPRRTPHAWQNIGEDTGRFFAAVIPAAPGFEEFFARYGALPPEERGLETFGRLAKETGAMDVIGPPLAVSDPLD